MRKRAILGGFLGLTVFGSVAMAASLGGISGASMGADDAVVASCDTDGVTLAWTTTYDATDSRSEVTQVTVSGIDNACDGRTMRVTLSNSSGTSLGEGSLTIPSDILTTSHPVTFSSPPSAESTANVHIVIS